MKSLDPTPTLIHTTETTCLCDKPPLGPGVPRLAGYLAELLLNEGGRIKERVDQWNQDHPGSTTVYMLGKIQFEMSNTDMLRLAKLLQWISKTYAYKPYTLLQDQPKLDDE